MSQRYSTSWGHLPGMGIRPMVRCGICYHRVPLNPLSRPGSWTLAPQLHIVTSAGGRRGGIQNRFVPVEDPAMLRDTALVLGQRLLEMYQVLLFYAPELRESFETIIEIERVPELEVQPWLEIRPQIEIEPAPVKLPAQVTPTLEAIPSVRSARPHYSPTGKSARSVEPRETATRPTVEISPNSRRDGT